MLKLITVLLIIALSIGAPKPPPPILCVDVFPELSEPMCAPIIVRPGEARPPSIAPPIYPRF